MKTYAFYVFAAVQGAMAQLPPGEVLVPDRLPALEDNHPAKVQTPDKFGRVCYQDSGAQILKRDENGIPVEVLKYPCISAQEIFGYCQKEEFNNVEAQKECLFGKDSTLESDYEGCVKCEEYNGFGSAEYINATRERIGQVKEAFLNGNQKFSDVDSKFPQPLWNGTAIKSNAEIAANFTAIKSKAEIAPNGTADINIRSYWKDYRLPQQAGAPIPDNKAVDNNNKDNKTISAPETSVPETKEVPISIGYFGWMTPQGQVEQSGSAKFRNVSAGAGEDLFLWMKRTYKLTVCISNAAPVKPKVDMEAWLKTVSEVTKFEPVREEPLYDTAQVVPKSSKEHESLMVTVRVNVVECGCFEKPEIKGVKISNPAAKGDGTKFITSVSVININQPGSEGQAPASRARTPSTEAGSGNDGTTPVRLDDKTENDAPGSGSDPMPSSGSSPIPSSVSTPSSNSGSKPMPSSVTPPAPGTPSTETAPKGAVGAAGNGTSTSCTGASCPSGVIVSGGSAVRTSSLIVAAAVLVAAL